MQFRDEYVKCLKRNVQLKYTQYQGMVKRRKNANKNKSQQNADNPKHHKGKKKDIMELQHPSSIYGHGDKIGICCN